jgi:hypothetical protein
MEIQHHKLNWKLATIDIKLTDYEYELMEDIIPKTTSNIEDNVI